MGKDRKGDEEHDRKKIIGTQENTRNEEWLDQECREAIQREKKQSKGGNDWERNETKLREVQRTKKSSE